MELDRAAVERVLRRASDMSPSHPEVDDQPAMSEELLLEAATEAGLDPDAVRLSLALERLGTPPDVRGLDRLSGPRHVMVDRVIRLPHHTVLARLDELLQRQHQLRRTRTRHDAAEWKRRTGAVGAVQRIAKRASGDVGLAKVAVVAARVSAIDDSRTVVRLMGDRADQRTEVITGGAITTGVGFVAAGTLALVATPVVLVGLPVAAAAGAGITSIGRRQRAALADELDRVLDAVEQGAPPVTLTDDVRRALRSLRS